MPFVNYVKEHEAFIEYAADNNFRPNEILVWLALFHIMNQRANGNYWPDGFIRVKNDRILTYAPIGFDSLSRARNTLAQRGLISYKPGKRNTDVPMYEMHYLTAAPNVPNSEEPVENPVDNFGYPVCYPHTADNMGGNMGGNIRGNIRGNMGGNIGYQYINLNNNETNQNVIDDDEDDVEASSRGRARAYAICNGEDKDEFAELDAIDSRLASAAAKAIRQEFGREATPAEVRAIAINTRLCGFNEPMLLKALQIAAQHGARTPLSYIRHIFDDWRNNDVTTPDEAEEYQFMEDARTGRNEFGSGDSVEDWRRMDQARKERRALHESAKGGGEVGSYSASGV